MVRAGAAFALGFLGLRAVVLAGLLVFSAVRLVFLGVRGFLGFLTSFVAVVLSATVALTVAAGSFSV